jgi:hypothetical protein
VPRRFPSLLFLSLLSLSVLSGVLVFPVESVAQDLRLIGQLRPRYEQRSPKVPAAPTGDVLMRTRIGVEASLPESVVFRVEIQDVVVWGGSGSAPGGSADPDVFQAFVEFGNLAGTASSIRVGRQEISLTNERLVSRNNWGHRGQRFDGVRLLLRSSGPTADLFSVRLLESGTGTGADAWFHGAHAEVPVRPGETLSLYALYNRERGPFQADQYTQTDQYTVGGHTQLTLGGIGWIGEGYLQRGTRRDQSVAAWFVAAGAARSLGPANLQILYEHHSGDGNASEGRNHAFDRLRGSNHGYHGYADLFTNVLANTNGHGLGDLSLRTRWTAGARTEVQLNGHRFAAAEQGDLPSARFGEEVDLVLTHRPRGGVAVEAGISHLIAGPALAEVRGLERDLTFGYAMVTVSF